MKKTIGVITTVLLASAILRAQDEAAECALEIRAAGPASHAVAVHFPRCEATRLWKALAIAATPNPGGFGEPSYQKRIALGGDDELFCYDFKPGVDRAGAGANLFCRLRLTRPAKPEAAVCAEMSRAFGGANFATRDGKFSLSFAGDACSVALPKIGIDSIAD